MSSEDDEMQAKLLVKGNMEDEDESKKVLLPSNTRKKNQKVQWNDNDGNSLTQVLEYQPSEASEFEDEESDACICNIM